MPAKLSIDADGVRTVANELGKIDSQLKNNDSEQLTALLSRLESALQYADVGVTAQLRQAINALNQVSSLLQEAQTRLIQVVNDTLHLEQDIAGGPGGSSNPGSPGGSGSTPPVVPGSNGGSGWKFNQFAYGDGYNQGAKGQFSVKNGKQSFRTIGYGVTYTGAEYTLGGSSSSPGSYGNIDAKFGYVQAGAGVNFSGDDFEKWRAGVFANATTASISANGRWGSQDLGISGSATASGPSGDVFAGYENGDLGVDIGGSIVSAQGSAGINIAGQNIGVDGSVGLQWHLGFSLGKDVEVKLPFVSFGFHW